MERDQKHVIPRQHYKRKRREYFHNEEREERLKAEEKENALKAEKEKKQAKNNEERVKDNLRKARIEKLTHDDGDKNQQPSEITAEQKSESARPLEETSSVTINGSEAKEPARTGAVAETTHQLNKSPHETSEATTKTEDEQGHTEDNHQTEASKHQYTTKRDWTEKVTQFISREWAKILIVLAAILVLLLLFAIFNNVNKSDNANMKQALETQQKEKGTNKKVTQTMANANTAVKSVVSIENNSQPTPDAVQDSDAQAQVEKESGSGVVYKKVGDTLYILTNAHVVGDRKEHELTFGNKQTAKAKVIGKYKMADIAVMTMRAPKGDTLKPLKHGDSSAVVLGEPVLVVGNPLSLDFQNTVGEGIVSGLNRDVPVDLNQDDKYDTLLSTFQVDAPINPGDSGGAVVDQEGHLIGIASLKINMPSVQNMGFAIPVNSALAIAQKIEKEGDIQQPKTDIDIHNVVDVDKATRDDYKIPQDVSTGVFVQKVNDNSPAKNSGLKKGDVIVELDSKPIKDNLAYKQKLTQHIDQQKPVKLKVLRENEVKEISFKLK
ncbi:TPA: serine protease [Staphylococcus pseudintermedius]|uniref:S1C family serine protease n=1 Tax=Staphylococcus pseudintermedius TaxID=283734 RepID=UPI0019FA4031|nr:S1C family serine protease [Staphylococcus pseudintermedius]EGQ3124559.1 serine protease [Staphylococcus pseudintermedius]EGQ3894642.1 serine protease [Staphylococcus pseudintermedius]EIA5025813.1 serine protease [Staphylococcus pseudintermedius]EIE3605016.1 serine protease [Staphylococcus pseudintermedius]EIO0097740.1 serine protease [Staphylococcus pseudintermedius]